MVELATHSLFGQSTIPSIMLLTGSHDDHVHNHGLQLCSRTPLATAHGAPYFGQGKVNYGRLRVRYVFSRNYRV